MNLRYNPDNDPLIQRARARNRSRSKWPFIIILLLAGWIAYSEWGRPRFSSRTTELTSTPRVIATADTNPQVSQETMGTPVGENYSLGFVPDNSRVIGATVQIDGKGSPALVGTNGLSMTLEADVIVDVLDVSEGMATLQMRSDNVNLYGNHFGNRVDLRRASGVTQDYSGDQLDPSPTFANQRTEKWSIEAFDHPATVRFGLRGEFPEAESLESVDRYYRFIVKLFTLVGVSFPEGQLQVGETWARELDLELFGLPEPARIIIETTIADWGPYYGQQCVYLISTIRPAEASGISAKVGRIDVSGESFAYYDPQIGRIVYGEATLELNLVLIEGLQSAADMLGVYVGMLDELEGGEEFDLSADPSQHEPLGLRVHSVVSTK